MIKALLLFIELVLVVVHFQPEQQKKTSLKTFTVSNLINSNI